MQVSSLRRKSAAVFMLLCCLTAVCLAEPHTKAEPTVIRQTEALPAKAEEVVTTPGRAGNVLRSQLFIGDGFLITPEGKVLNYSHSEQFQATAYTHTDAGCNTTTATGTTVHHGTVAVDPRQIPYFTKMYIVTNDGSYIYGESRAEDCGGAIQGKRLDLYFGTTAQCFQFGVRNCTVYFLTD